MAAAPPLLQVKNLSKSYGARSIFRSASLALSTGQKVGVIGRNGAGKSTLFRMIIGTEERDSGDWAVSAEFRPAFLSQDARFGEHETVLEFLERASGRESWECARMAARFQIAEERLNEPAHNLSGGFQMRVRLAAMLLEEPNFLFLDEPTNYLDLETLFLLEDFLRGYSGGFFVISHDRQFLRNTCDHTLEVENGELFLFPGDVDAYLEFKAEREAELVRQNRNIEAQRKQLEAFVERFRAKASKAAQAQSKIKQLSRLQPVELSKSLATVRIRIPEVPRRKGQAVRLEHVSIGYPERMVASDIDVIIRRGARVAVVGANGQGKSTLLRTLAGSLSPISGNVHWNDPSPGFYAQHVFGTLPENKTVLEVLMTHAGGKSSRQDILDLAGAFLFKGNDVDKRIAVLSGGERARVSLASLLLGRHSTLLLDEPTNHLDFETVEALGAALRDYAGTLLFVSHDRTFVNLVADEVLEVHDGQVRLFPGNYHDYVYRLSQLQEAEEARAREQSSSRARAGRPGRASPSPSEPESIRSHAEPAGSPRSPNAHVQRKERRSELKSARTELARLEARMTQLAAERDELTRELAAGANGYTRERTLKLAETAEALTACEEKWIEQSARVERLQAETADS